jgi:beta-galactosidase
VLAGFSLDAMNVHEEAKAYHTALMDLNITTDALDPRLDLSRYRLVIAPRLYCMDNIVAENLLKFVDAGGVLCLTPRSGVVDEYNVIVNQPAPGLLSQTAGVEIDEYGALEAPLASGDPLDWRRDRGSLGQMNRSTSAPVLAV